MSIQHSISPVRIALPTAKGLVFFALDDLLYFEADNKECVLCYQEKRIIKTTIIFKGITVLEAKLQLHGFLLVRRDVLINTAHITLLTTDKTLVMTDGKTIHPSLRKIQKVEAYLIEHFGL